ncbi:hypothetical protein CathTA2_0651 [Caldalkalibacillus thermarum TA2.A1]|uniref:RNA polymerase sigma factor SigI n=1 Tax=Caldalkalibacillus thermarum (strain TA2.A1) TaxID=986075 RepID=F5L4D9_CALTT|nr:hypothetical protein [Caldalkalibacillus thermarum]EGL83782.1 hypothetical protein CathTA2_0651 [Caldalkalibacillus thermarum TA2.A1]QZT33958.1 hypothetical protein HUR95_00510 [Caldalkalibacillus thermarum TA2.A1]
MNAIDLQTSITAAQRGDDIVREKLIRRYRPFILNTVGHICQRYVTWNKEHAVQSYHQDLQSAELVEEIIEFEHQLARFNIAFEELERVAPQHRDTRERLFQIADDFVRDEELVRHLFEKKRLPVSLFTKRTGYRPKTIERHRKYLITLIVLKLNPQWVHLSQFIKSPAGNGGSS